MATACNMAVARGIREIAFAEHVDFEPLDAWAGYFQPAAYVAEIERCRRTYGDVLVIRAGVEASEGHAHQDQMAALLGAYAFDFVLGAAHWVKGRLAMDAPYFAGRTVHEGLQTYFEELARLAAEADYDVLAHFDIVRRAVFHFSGLKEVDYTPYEGTIRGVLRTLVERGKGLEINTATHRRGMGDPNPTLQVLRWYRELGGEVLTLGSDAHTADAIGSCFDVALDMARAAGFTRLATFERRQIRWMSI
jgi:histidinol-phosphatase (PHP family)